MKYIHPRRAYNTIMRSFRDTSKLFGTFISDLVFDIRGKKMRKGLAKSVFYIPYYRTDYIQSVIRRSKDYFERTNLDYVCKSWKQGSIGKAIQENVVLDIGANIGNHTLYYANEIGTRTIHCFEPIADTFRILKRNIELNKLSNRVHLHNIAVGRSNGHAEIKEYDKKNIGGTSVKESNTGSIKLMTIDSLDIKDKIGFVKIDVEGFELEVLYGMKETLKRDKPYIACEIRNHNLDEATTFLQEFGYVRTEIQPPVEWRNYNDYLFYLG